MIPTQITVIAATNRVGALSAQIAAHYAALLEQKGHPRQVLSLSELPADFIAKALYEHQGQHAGFNRLRAIMEATQKYVFIVPEYNGSFPGVLKAFIDGLQFPDTFKGKKCALVGVSKGPQGATQAMSHLTDIFHYLRMHVHPLKPRLAGIQDSQLATVLANAHYVKLLDEQATSMMAY